MKLSTLSIAVRATFLFPAIALSNTTLAAETNTQNDVKIESIVVTGHKIARSLQETTTSVAVLTAETIEHQQINTFTDALVSTANAHATDYGFSIRGIDGSNVSGDGHSALASVYIDGAPVPQGLIRNGTFSTWDATQIEILRGPQSTLQGRNSLAGAVILNTQAPSYDKEGQFKLTLGENNKQEAGIALGGGLIDDELAFRFSGEEKRYDGSITNLYDNSHSDTDNEHTYRLKLRYEPAGMENLSTMFSVMNAERKYGDANLTKDAGADTFSNRSTSYNDTRQRQVKTDLVSLSVNYDINSLISLASYTTYSDVVEIYSWDSDYPQGYGNAPVVDTGSAAFYNNEEKTLTQEFRVNFDYDNFSGVAGAYYFKSEQEEVSTGFNNYSLARLGLSSSALQSQYKLSPHIADLVLGQYADFNPAKTKVYSLTTSNITSYALFADGVWHLNEHWDLLAGIRFDREKQENTSEAQYDILNKNALPNPSSYIGTPYEGVVPLISGINALVVGLADSASQVAPLSDASFSTVLPKVGVSYHVNDDISTTFTFQKGYRSGGVGVNQARANVFVYKPESTDNYELSVRSTWLDGKFTANANLFYLDWKDQQVSAQLSPNNFDIQTVNAGTSEVKGFELELNYTINDNLKTYAAIGYAGTEFTDFTIKIPNQDGSNTNFDLSGRPFPAPQRTHNIGLTYQDSMGFFANLNISYASESPNRANPYRDGLEPGDLYFDLHNDARTIVDMQLGYEWDNYGIYLVGKNITDEEYYVAHRARNPRIGKPSELSLTFRGTFDW
ncbi:hypothetical protein PCIT_a3852 [Pseudoalteromonas citrea]|uniref:TonB-dependent receptor n=2 Tax=Pseudoalteromonas citrea TaxID=43655 RepID=A0AAD4FQX7_9GAMM|nr:TonB-dependent receptor [Pseudoalteromonas citrea]KAF7767764.1 hypothetical protein PCIT_a3852 [Pseudoalteromonas citrea]